MSQVSGTQSRGVKRKRTRGPHAAASRRMTVPRNRLNFPGSLRTTLRYVTRAEFSLTSTGAVQFSIRANDLYDPEVSVGGHQPRGFDEMMEVYGKFTVIGSKISAQYMYEGYTGPSQTGSAGNLIQTLSSASGTPGEVPALPPVAVGIHTGTEVLAAGTAAEQMEKERTSWSFLTPATGIETRSARSTQKDFFGKEFVVGAEGYTGNDSSSPDETILYEVWAARLDDNYNAGTVRIPTYITVEYDTVFTDPKTLSAS